MSNAKGKTIINDLTEGSLPRKLLRFAVPFIFSNMLQVFYSLVDMVVVGRFVGSFGLSAVTIASQVFNFATMFALGFSNGGQVLIAQLVGAGLRGRLNRAIGTIFSVVLLLGLGMSVVVLSLRGQVLRLLDTPQESFSMAMDYMLVCGIGLTFTYGYNMVSAVLRGMGDSRHPFVFIVIASLINLVLDLLFTGLLGWGVAGAAAATIIGQAFSFGYALFFLYRNRENFGFDFKPRSFRINGPDCKSLFKLGIPYAIQSGAINISMMFVSKLVNGVGVFASAVFGVGIKIDDIVTKGTQGLNFALSSTVAQSVAAGKRDRAVKAVYWCWLFTAVFYGIFTILLVTMRDPLFMIFTDDPKVIELAPVFVSAIVWGFPFMVMMKGCFGFIQGIGNAPLAMALGLLDGVVLRIGLSYLIGIVMGYGLWGFFFGYGIAAIGVAVPGSIYFFSGVWKKRKLLASRGDATE